MFASRCPDWISALTVWCAGIVSGSLFWRLLAILLAAVVFVLLRIHFGHRRAMRSRLRQAEHLESLGRLAGGIAHDFNNMLSGMLGAAELALDHAAHQPELRERLELIRNITLRAADLTRALQTFARRDAHILRPVDLHKILKDIVAFFGRSVDRRITVTTHFTAADSSVLADSTLLQNAILNLFVNARDAMLNGGVLTVCSRNRIVSRTDYLNTMPKLAEGHYLEVTVSDTGTGIPPEVLKHIFEPFFSTKPLDQGSGLGLAAVYGTVCQHHGAVECKSSPGYGTVFTLYFPVARVSSPSVPDSPSRADISPAANSSDVTLSARILVLDDEPAIREVIVQTLRVLGHHPIPSATSDEALRLIHGEATPDLAILDMILPGGSGLDLAQQIWEIYPKMPVIFASGLSQKEIDPRLFDQRTILFLHKPFGRKDMDKAIRAALSRSRPVAPSTPTAEIGTLSGHE